MSEVNINLENLQRYDLNIKNYVDVKHSQLENKTDDIIGSNIRNKNFEIGTISQGSFGGQNENISSNQVCRSDFLEVNIKSKIHISLPNNIKYMLFYGDTPTYSSTNTLKSKTSTWTDDEDVLVSAKYIRFKFAAYDNGGNRIDITPDMLDDLVITYDDFKAIPAQILKDKIVRVSSNTATAQEKQYADYLCDGIADEVQINQALQDLAKLGGGTLELSSGTFYLDNYTKCSDDVNRYIILPDVDGITIGINGKGGMAYNDIVGTCIELSYSAYTALDNSDEDTKVIIGQPYIRDLPATVFYMNNIRFRSPNNQKRFIFIDLKNLGRASMEHVYAYGYKSTTSASLSPAVEGLVGCRMLNGTNFGTENTYLSCGMNGCYEGWQVGSEHVYMRQCSAICNVYGFTFGNYPYTGTFLHPITLIRCTDERNVNMPLFKSCGWGSGNWTEGQRVNIIDFSIERKASGTPGGVLGDRAVEYTDGSFNGEITYTIVDATTKNLKTISFFQSGGSKFKVRNSEQELYGTNTLRDSFAPNNFQEFYSTDDNCLYRYVNGQWVKDYDDTSLKNAIDAINDTLYPRITKQPEDIFGAMNAIRNISITAVGTNLTYQWQLSNDNGTTWIDSTSTGYNTDTLTVTIGNTQFNGRLYRCKVTDADNNVLYSDTCMCIIKSSFASIAQIKAGTENINTIVPANQFQAVFYGMAKAAGDATQASSENPVGEYTADAIIKILKMLGIEVIEESDYESLVTPEQKIYLITEDDV